MVEIRKTFTTEVTIWVGLREETDTGYIIHDVSEVELICQEYVDNIGLCVTVTPTKFVYTGGNESGVSVGLINYPRFPEQHSQYVINKAIDLAKILRERLGQTRVSVVAPHDTFTIGEFDD